MNSPQGSPNDEAFYGAADASVRRPDLAGRLVYCYQCRTQVIATPEGECPRAI